VRTHDGVEGTGPETLTTLSALPNWISGPAAGAPWAPIERGIAKGPPNSPYVGGVPNAFVLLQSRAYGVSSDEWVNKNGTAYFRHDFQLPLQGFPRSAQELTGRSP